MKKLLKVEMIDGTMIERDLTDEKEIRRLPVGTAADDMAYAQLCQGIACCGYTSQDPDVGPKKYKHIAPSQIKSVTVEFID